MSADSAGSWSLASDQPLSTLRSQGFVYLNQTAMRSLTGLTTEATAAWADTWNDLAVDRYLKDGGRYRRRRHSCFVQEVGDDAAAGTITQVPHRPHWQSTDYNALHGGIDRMFEPMPGSVSTDPAWLSMLAHFGQLFAAASPIRRWYIEAHQFRIDTSDGVGRPTPEGAHRDGVDFVVVMLIDRRQVKGGETRIFDANGPLGMRFVMSEPWSAVLLDDKRMIHEATPIQPETGQPAKPGPDAADSHRDTLVLTFRANGFQQRGA